ncbi:hypothetical protein INR49_015091 [Caranx melampygus]|nr:hypothetical protein INR49_015091 [Caranx melampygus]
MSTKAEEGAPAAPLLSLRRPRLARTHMGNTDVADILDRSTSCRRTSEVQSEQRKATCSRRGRAVEFTVHVPSGTNACCLTLDPKTAHSNLTVSKDNKRVTESYPFILGRSSG